MIACPSCGCESPDGFLHCGFCAAPLIATSSARRRLATLVFCDLVGSTALGEQVDPEPLQELMQRYFHEMRSALERHGGRVEKFIGDAVVGVFGVPVANEDDALRACRAALEMQARLAAIAPELERRFGSAIEVRIGVNSGEVVGSPETFVTGDAVNVAARLEQAARPGEVLLGETTWRLVRAAVTAEPVEPVAAKGKAEPLVAFRLLEMSGPTLRAETPLVGRQAELELLEHELDVALAARSCSLLTVAGEPGLGKSRLVAELTRRVAGKARVTRGACLSYGEGITFWPVAEIVRDLAGIRDEHSADEARRRVPVRIAQLLGLAQGTATAEQTSAAIAEFLGAAAADEPLLVVVEDVHWAEAALLDLLSALPQALADAAVVILCLARPELRELRPDWRVTVELEPLGAADVDALLESLEAPPPVRVRIALAAAGNPLFAEELVAWARDGGDVDALPTTLNALLGARLDRLKGEERDALERGAVEGELFHRGAVLELSDEDARSAVGGGLDELTRKDLVRLTAASFAGEIVAYRFKHVLVREAAYRATAKKLRATLHERYADWLERRVGERVGEYDEVLGYHLEQAYMLRSELGPVDGDATALAARAGRHLGAAGARAVGRGDYRAAVNLLERSTQLVPRDTVEGVKLLRHYGGALNGVARHREARAVYDEVIERADALGEVALAARARSALVGQRIFGAPKPDYVADRAILETGLTAVTSLGDALGMAEHERQLGLLCRVEGRNAEGAEWLERALLHAAECDDQVTVQGARRSLAGALLRGPTHVSDAIVRCDELLAESRGDPVTEANVASSLSALHAMAGHVVEARAYGAVADRVYGDVDTWFAALGQDYLATARELCGDVAGAARALEAKHRFYSKGKGGEPDGRAIDATNALAHLLCRQGRWEEAEQWLALYEGVQRNLTTGKVANIYRGAARALLAAHHGRHADALAHVQRSVGRAEMGDNLGTRADAWLALASVHRAGGAAVEADDALAAAVAYYEQKGNVAALRLLGTAPYATTVASTSSARQYV